MKMKCLLTELQDPLAYNPKTFIIGTEWCRHNMACCMFVYSNETSNLS